MSGPPVWVGHVVLETDRLAETAQFMRKIGIAPSRVVYVPYVVHVSYEVWQESSRQLVPTSEQT